VKDYHIAQINIAKAKAGLDSKIMQGFVDRLDEINSLADASPGFVWRLQAEGGNATSIQAFGDPNILINMSVWKNVEALKNFVYRSLHVELISQRDAWFDKLTSVHQTLWYIPAGTIPSIEEGREKLRILQEKGPTIEAFTFAKVFECERS
jgi:hypothetical protein